MIVSVVVGATPADERRVRVRGGGTRWKGGTPAAAENAYGRQLAELMGGRCGGPAQMDEARQKGVDRPTTCAAGRGAQLKAAARSRGSARRDEP